jgi:hypothetical protein
VKKESVKDLKDRIVRLEAEAWKAKNSVEALAKADEKLATAEWARKGVAHGIEAVTTSLRAVVEEMMGRGKPGIPDSFVIALCDYLDLLAQGDCEEEGADR